MELYWPRHVYGESTGPGEKISFARPSCFNKTRQPPRRREPGDSMAAACGGRRPRPGRCRASTPAADAMTSHQRRAPIHFSQLSRHAQSPPVVRPRALFCLRHRACAHAGIFNYSNHSSATTRVLNANEHRIMSRHLKHVQRQRRLVLQQAIDRPPGRNPQPTI